MRIHELGKAGNSVILLLPGTMCFWRGNFGSVIDELAQDFLVAVVAYTGFDEADDESYVSVMDEVKRIETYIQEHYDGAIREAYGCSLGGTFVAHLAARHNVHMRYGVIGSLCNGTALVKKDSSCGWWKVRTMNGREGWVSSKYVRENARANVNTRETGLNVRSSRCTSSSSNILYSIPHGTKGITVYKVNCDWAYVKWGCHQKGWASLRYLKWTRW